MNINAFFNRPTLDVAQELIGAQFQYQNHKGIITETEAYIGDGDPACHASKGRTPRTEVMFGPPGYTYVYLIYGMYHCLNFVTEKEGFPAAVLIRGIKLVNGHHLDGPGKLCRDIGITKDCHNNKILNTPESGIYIQPRSMTPRFKVTPRIGIKQGTDKLWRFVMENA